ncbi:MAG: cbb3-type cytochrome c oxidase subunit II [Gemmatales bacterium]|nr:cbb3-type cytochrome c oxidase subunit II [Gemmatales bacterium]MDW8387566.1 cbb3-type cytochrome c oxidase subunit II [Gemmatales bacterium]
MFESRTGILLIAGLGFFALAFLSNGLVPILMYRDMPEQTAEEVVNRHLLIQFDDLRSRYPEGFAKLVRHLGHDPEAKPTPESDRQLAAETLRYARKLYIGEACWHCHSQFVRPVSNESRRWGPVAKSWEYQNELQRPVLFGTRRVGPDLSREGGRRSNDWHAVHFFKPTSLVEESVMPEYPWFFDGDPNHPNERGIAMIAYMQWLGSWLPHYFNNYVDPRLAEAQP